MVKHIAQRINDITSDQSGYSICIPRDIAGQTMHICAEDTRIKWAIALSQKRSKDPGEHIASPAGGHPRIAGKVQIALLAVCHNGAIALQNHHGIGGQIGPDFDRRTKSILLDFLRGDAQKSGSFTWMRCHNNRRRVMFQNCSVCGQRGEGVECVSIQYQWLVGVPEDFGHQVVHALITAQTRASSDHSGFLNQRLKFVPCSRAIHSPSTGLRQRPCHIRRLNTGHALLHFMRAGDSNQSGTTSESSQPSQSSGPGHPAAAGDHENVTIIAFVRIVGTLTDLGNVGDSLHFWAKSDLGL